MSLEQTVERARARLIEIAKRKPTYVATSLSSLEIQAALMQLTENGETGNLFLPTHHAVGYYALLSAQGQDIDFAKLNTKELPYVFHIGGKGGFYNSGSLGDGAVIGIMKANLEPEKKSYIVLGNSEMREGITSEALAFAEQEDLNNVVVMVNDNGKGLDGEEHVDYAARLQSHGFEVREVNGHDLVAVQAVLEEARGADKRYGIVFKTERGHKTELAEMHYDGKAKSGSSKALGHVIECVARDIDFDVLAADTAGSTGLDGILAVDPNRFTNVGCAEQFMVQSIEAYQLAGRPVVAGTFAKFLLERAKQQIEHLINNYKEKQVKTPTVLFATHNGLSSGLNGRSHHCGTAYEWLAREGVNVYHANGETQAEAMLRDALDKPELSVIITERETKKPKMVRNGKDMTTVDAYEDLYKDDPSYQFVAGQPEELTDFEQDGYTLVIANGYRSYDAVEVAVGDKEVEVLSLPSFPLDEQAVVPYLQKAKKVVVAEESSDPFLGRIVEGIARNNGLDTPFTFLHTTQNGFGNYDDLLKLNGLDEEGIRRAV